MQQPPAAVWEAIAQADGLAAWLYPNNFEPRVGHVFSFHVPANPKVNFLGLEVRCEVLVCEPVERLVFTWAARGLESQVSFDLKPDGAGTCLLFEHGGFDVSTPLGDQAYKGAGYGWTRSLALLTSLVAGKATNPDQTALSYPTHPLDNTN
jgi:uncharacterized protein YndB with AHSA1/START domain